MHENGHVSCLELAGRASNDELRAWLAADAGSDSQAFPLLFQAVTPLLLAYFEGKLQQHCEDLDALTLETLLAVYLHRASYDPAQPFRAWLLGIARLSLTDYLHNGCVSGKSSRQVASTRLGAMPEMERETLHRLQVLARRQIERVRTTTDVQQANTRKGRLATA